VAAAVVAAVRLGFPEADVAVEATGDGGASRGGGFAMDAALAIASGDRWKGDAVESLLVAAGRALALPVVEVVVAIVVAVGDLVLLTASSTLSCITVIDGAGTSSKPIACVSVPSVSTSSSGRGVSGHIVDG
jgi:hypothetical protein